MVWRVTRALYLFTAAQGILGRPDFYAHQRVGRVHNVSSSMLMLWISSTFSSEASPELSRRWKLTAYFPGSRRPEWILSVR